ncbi:hypothetical protein DE146DRAFT_33694 [Phaeosphaeria sp. MPI-PUGE-AT-0046c]|nr:hypothetical protein DE146DRAFT_33694 [Phaeosphaeria sp. MPI-PUGE-AT-0046c]
MGSPDEYDYDTDEWSYKTKYSSGARHVHRSEAAQKLPPRKPKYEDEYRPEYGRRTSEFLNPEVHYTTNLHRTRSQGHAPTPNVTIYNTTRMDNESSPNVRTEHKDSSADRGRQTQARRIPGEWALEDQIAELQLELRKDARSRSRHDYRHHSHSPHRHYSPHRADPRDYEDKIQLTLAQQKLKEAEDKLERERREDEIERREDLIKRKLEIKYIKDRAEREAEEDRIRLQEDRLKHEWDLKREREERDRDARAREEKEREKRIIAENRANMSREKREKEEERDRLIAEMEREKREQEEDRRRLLAEQRAKMSKEKREKEEERDRIIAEMEKEKHEHELERKRIIDENTAKLEKEARERADKAKAMEEERKRIIIENEAKVRQQELEVKEAQQRAVDDFNKKRAKEEQEAKEERERIVYEYERKKAKDAEEAKRQREELIMQLKIEEERQKEKDKAEYEAFLQKQKAKEEEEKAKKKEQEDALERAMRDRLSQFGFQDNQIQALVHPEKQKELQQGLTPHNPLRIAPQPTYAKISRTHLDIETLHYYDIPYEFDMDPNYVIVLREMSQRETDVLFEHTRRLRSNHGDRLFIESEGRDRRGKKEYAFVRKPSRSRSRSDVGRGDRKKVTLGDMLFR